MHTCGLSCSDNGCRLGVGRKSSDIFRHRPIEQFDVPRHVSDVPAEILERPLLERSAIEADFSACRLPYANNGACER